MNNCQWWNGQEKMVVIEKHLILGKSKQIHVILHKKKENHQNLLKSKSLWELELSKGKIKI